MIQFGGRKVKKSLILKKKIVLASTSPYRAELLSRLQIAFVTARPNCDETPLPGELPTATALRLAETKARSVAAEFPDALVIGSDQVAALAGQTLGKPGTRERATAQLSAMRGQRVIFHTAVSLLDTTGMLIQSRVIDTLVDLRQYSDAEIAAYLDREHALDCAGSAKSEGLGVALIQRMQSDDPTALIGLPLIALIDLLQERNFRVLA
jgi:septum formation protein